MRSPASPVRPLVTTESDIIPAPLLPVPARSRSGAIAACRAAGLRVMHAGGHVELGVEIRGPWNDETPVWFVTVHP